MSDLSERIVAEMNTETVFTIPVFGGIGVDEGTVVTWIIMAVMIAAAALLTRNLRVDHISKKQAAVEAFVTKLEGAVTGILGADGERYVPYLVTVLVYIGFANVVGVFGFKPPTKDLNVTLALAVMSIVLVQAASIRKRRVGGWLKSFTKPLAIVTPFNILDLVTRPLSLCMRLFGNVLGAFVVMVLLESAIPVAIPAVFSLYFDFFDGFLQAYVFVFLTGVYIKEAIELSE
ncbi:MAG TPA: F0F1 ATP synthase subunit A [Oscillospiraceae bacterium]|nr:F0F1 ATP synthase subunit A [Oscillospiraceae bacterium]HNW04213.1 F0F1 ATP synthase subunit A [Oscillospiraceae bacterium]